MTRSKKVQAMLKVKRVAHSFSPVEHTDREPISKNKVRGTKASPDFDLRSEKDYVVRIVHRGGQQEVYQHAFPASKLMSKYPGMCVAQPEVFRAPHHSVLGPEELLLIGHKYIIISSRDVEKLKRKHPLHGQVKEPNEVVTQETFEAMITRSPSGHKPKEKGKISVLNGLEGQEMDTTRITQSPKGNKIHENRKVKEAKGQGKEEVNAKMHGSPGGGAVEESFRYAKDFYVPNDKSTKYTRRKGIKGKKPFVPPLPKIRSYRGLGWQPSLPTVQELSP